MSGVSSTTTLTPVAFSKARTLRPSLPMIRLLRLSLGIVSVEVAACSASSTAQR